MMEKKFQRVGCVGRFRPLHNGSALMLDTACLVADHVVIGIGSANKYNVRNPFTIEETREMIERYLAPRFSNYEIHTIDDFGHIPEFQDGQRWREEMRKVYGTLDAFLTGNPYVHELLKEDYMIVHPDTLASYGKRKRISGSLVRVEMAKFGAWEQYVPESVAQYLKEHDLVARFQREFGSETLMRSAEKDIERPESYDEERRHAEEE